MELISKFTLHTTSTPINGLEKFHPLITVFAVPKTQKNKRIITRSNNHVVYSIKSDFNSMNIDDIDRQIEILQKDLLWLRIKQATRQDFNPADVRAGEREIAQLLGARRMKQDANKINNGRYRKTKKFHTRFKDTSKMLRYYQVNQQEVR